MNKLIAKFVYSRKLGPKLKNLPKQIDDYIRDSYVEIRYTGKHPFEVLMGYIYQAASDGYKYANKPPSKRQQIISPPPEGNIRELIIGPQGIFLYNEKIKIQFQPGIIIFNCLDSYVLWDNYSILIKDILRKIHHASIITSYNRVGIRYISDYPDVDLTENLNFSYTIDINDINITSSTFRSEIQVNEFSVILNLGNGILLPPKAKNGSFVDIDVYKDNLNIIALEELETIIDNAHLIEKKLFFNLLKDDFIKSLNPIYL